MVGIPVWSHCYNSHSAAYDSVRFGCEQLIHGFDIDERTMDLMAEQGTFFTPTIGFLPTWYSTYLPAYVPEIHDRFPGDTLAEKELQRNYDCLREAKRRGVVNGAPTAPRGRWSSRFALRNRSGERPRASLRRHF